MLRGTDDLGAEAVGRIVRIAATREQLESWLAVLGSQGLRAGSAQRAEGLALIVPAEEAERAAAMLDLYEAENAVRAEPPPPDAGPTQVALVAALALIAFFVESDPAASTEPWFNAGVASSELILQGQLWRTVTALTLHLDLGHVVGNAVFLTLFGNALCRALGSGLGCVLLVGGGALGNALCAALRGPGHSSVGASTAVFAAVGCLAMIEFHRRRRGRARPWRAWLPLAAGVAVLSFVGANEGADVLAHLSGLLAGLVLGGFAAALPGLGAGTQRALLAFAGAVVLASWAVAL